MQLPSSTVASRCVPPSSPGGTVWHWELSSSVGKQSHSALPLRSDSWDSPAAGLFHGDLTHLLRDIYIYIYIHIYTKCRYICICIYIYIYMFILYLHIYIYIISTIVPIHFQVTQVGPFHSSRSSRFLLSGPPPEPRSYAWAAHEGQRSLQSDLTSALPCGAWPLIEENYWKWCVCLHKMGIEQSQHFMRTYICM